MDALKGAGFTAAQLKDADFNAIELKAAGFSAGELTAAKFSPGTLLKAGFNAANLKAAGITVQQLWGDNVINIGSKELKEAGFSAEELKTGGVPEQRIKEAGYTDQQLIDAGILKRSFWGIYTGGVKSNLNVTTRRTRLRLKKSRVITRRPKSSHLHHLSNASVGSTRKKLKGKKQITNGSGKAISTRKI